jgi:selenocysteine lyase/cysteine desulfurase
MVSRRDPDGTLSRSLTAAGVRHATRAGAVRLAFHVWNDRADVERVLRVVGSTA